MLQFALCDDNKSALDRLCLNLKSIFEKNNINANVSFATTNPNKLLKYSMHKKIDVFILDIDLCDKVSGIELAKSIRKHNKDAYIIFVTAHIEFSMIAYKVKTFDYLVKPLSISKLEETILRLNEDIQNSSSLFVKLGSGKHLFNANDILYIEKNKAKAIVHTTSSNVQIYGTIENIMNCLPEYFVRCSKSYIVNIQKITLIDSKNHTFYINDNIINYSGKYINYERKMIYNENVFN